MRKRRLTALERRLFNEYTRLRISRFGKCKYFVGEFVVDNQSFALQAYEGTKTDAQWYRRQIAIGLAKFLHETHGWKLRQQRTLRASRGAETTPSDS